MISVFDRTSGRPDAAGRPSGISNPTPGTDGNHRAIVACGSEGFCGDLDVYYPRTPWTEYDVLRPKASRVGAVVLLEIRLSAIAVSPRPATAKLSTYTLLLATRPSDDMIRHVYPLTDTPWPGYLDGKTRDMQ